MAHMYTLSALPELDMRIIAHAIHRVRSRSQHGWPSNGQRQQWTIRPETLQNRATKYDLWLPYSSHSKC